MCVGNDVSRRKVRANKETEAANTRNASQTGAGSKQKRAKKSVTHSDQPCAMWRRVLERAEGYAVISISPI